MIDVKEAAERAAQYFGNLYSDRQYSDVLLEEVELTDDEKNWLITLSYAYEPPVSPLSKVLEGSVNSVLVPPKPKPRKAKVFKIDAATGNVKYMRMRNLN
ncbi:MAG TPA: hypothetical protein VLM38_16360 [Blastocatellia bacterium]|nr:hypothetical protein [Blastocatellia bacterium]